MKYLTIITLAASLFIFSPANAETPAYEARVQAALDNISRSTAAIDVALAEYLKTKKSCGDVAKCDQLEKANIKGEEAVANFESSLLALQEAINAIPKDKIERISRATKELEETVYKAAVKTLKKVMAET